MIVEELVDLLYSLGLEKIREPKRGNIQFCCPFHADRNPSAGISLDEPHIGNCFSCGGFTLQQLVSECKGFKRGNKHDIYKANNWLEEKFGTEFRRTRASRELPRYEERVNNNSREDNDILYPEYKLATFRCGKATYDLFFNWGFKEQTVRDFEIGADSVYRRIVVPIRDRQEGLRGCVGRATVSDEYIQINKRYTVQTLGGEYVRFKLPKCIQNPRYFNYWNFPKEVLVFPLNKFKLTKKLNYIIICEGILDAIWLHQMGYTNALSIIGSKISKEQIKLISELGKEYSFFSNEVISMLDNDEAGEKGNQRIIKYMKKDFLVTKISYPKNKKDPRECNKKQVEKMIKDRQIYCKKALDRIA